MGPPAARWPAMHAHARQAPQLLASLRLPARSPACARPGRHHAGRGSRRRVVARPRRPRRRVGRASAQASRRHRAAAPPRRPLVQAAPPPRPRASYAPRSRRPLRRARLSSLAPAEPPRPPAPATLVCAHPSAAASSCPHGRMRSLSSSFCDSGVR
ncbi:uncharacterized protein [Miscanthus floridulus]|uniref:uncharacterized protein n=1 Tax=Miscanthus floridulus TaxID=154761 RepID=UPI003458E477